MAPVDKKITGRLLTVRHFFSSINWRHVVKGQYKGGNTVHRVKSIWTSLFVICLPAICYGQDDASWLEYRPELPQQEIRAIIQEARENAQIQIEEAEIIAREALQRVRENTQGRQDRIREAFNTRHAQRQKVRPQRPRRSERPTERRDDRSSPRLDRNDPFLKEMRDEQRQLRDSSSLFVPGMEVPVIPVPPMPFTPTQEGAMVPFPYYELGQLRAHFEAIQPELDRLRENMAPFREQFENFQENFQENFNFRFDMAPLELLSPDTIKLPPIF